MSTMRRFLILAAILSLGLSYGCSDDPDGDAGDTGTGDVAPDDTAVGDVVDATDTAETGEDAPGDTAEADAGDASDASSALSWASCYSDYECTDVDVPLDYENPEGDQISVRVIRKPAANPAEKIGTVMMNFGGPGASGVSIAGNDMFPLLPIAFPKAHQRFDVVAVEPRGTAETSPAVDCVDDAELDSMREVDAMPDDDSDWETLSATWDSFVAGCQETHSTEYLAQTNTANTVRDMETVRQRLGEETINFVGISYGTYVGALYANMYPDRVRAFVLDSNMHPTRKNMVDHIKQGADEFGAGLTEFFENCGDDDSCEFHGGEGASAVESALEQLLADLEASPVELEDGRTVSALDATMALAAALRGGVHERLAGALADAESDDGAELMSLADAFWMRDDDGTYGHFVETYITTMIADSSCPDDLDRQTLETMRTEAAEQRPFLGRMEIALAHACTAWPDVGDGTADITATDAPPMLIINAERDAATPMANAEAMQSALDNGSHLLRWEGRTHGVVTESACAREVVDQFMIEPETAPETTRCTD